MKSGPVAKSWLGHTRRLISGMSLVLLIGVFVISLLTLPISWHWMNVQDLDVVFQDPALSRPASVDADPLTIQSNLWITLGKPFAYLFGTDGNGRSVFWRAWMGGSISLGIGVCASLIAAIVGTTWGMLAGYLGGWLDALLMRFVDVLYGLPYILIVVLLMIATQGLKDRSTKWGTEVERQAAAVAQGLNPDDPQQFKQVEDTTEKPVTWQGSFAKWVRDNNTILDLMILLIAISAVNWLTLARVVRGQTLSLRNQPFIESARAVGMGHRRILFRQILPNLLGPVIVYTTLAAPQAILQESFLSFLGIGVRDPLTSWGLMAAEGRAELNPVKSYWWMLVVPCAFLAFTLLSLNIIGDSLRDRFDPREKNERLGGRRTSDSQA